MHRNSPDVEHRMSEYLTTIVPDVLGVLPIDYGVKESLQFYQRVPGTSIPEMFPASSMSDGTLRALGVLVALFQTGNESGLRVSLVGIEEPETALHPAAVAVLLDALEEGNLTRQVLVTSHSADLLDNKRIDPDALLAVASHQGATEIGPIDEVSRSVLRDRLYTAGEMLRMSQFAPDTDAMQQNTVDQTQNYNGERRMRRVSISCIVEGQGDMEAVPILIRRIVTALDPTLLLHIPLPSRVSRSKIVKSQRTGNSSTLRWRQRKNAGHGAHTDFAGRR